MSVLLNVLIQAFITALSGWVSFIIRSLLGLGESTTA